MAVKKSHYEELLAEYCDHAGAIALLKQYRPYLEMIPSMRRPAESVITIPLPLIRVRNSTPATDRSGTNSSPGEAVRLPCEVAILMCDPEWKVKTGAEIFVFIHRPHEDFSDLLSRWRHTQLYLDRGYEWLMPSRYSHILNEGADEIHPLFVIHPATPERIRKGLQGAALPFVTEVVYSLEDDSEVPEAFSPEAVDIED